MTARFIQTLLIIAWIYPRKLEEGGKGKGKAREVMAEEEEEELQS
jgi:hypothetical protein